MKSVPPLSSARVGRHQLWTPPRSSESFPHSTLSSRDCDKTHSISFPNKPKMQTSTVVKLLYGNMEMMWEDWLTGNLQAFKQPCKCWKKARQLSLPLFGVLAWWFGVLRKLQFLYFYLIFSTYKKLSISALDHVFRICFFSRSRNWHFRRIPNHQAKTPNKGYLRQQQLGKNELRKIARDEMPKNSQEWLPAFSGKQNSEIQKQRLLPTWEFSIFPPSNSYHFPPTFIFHSAAHCWQIAICYLALHKILQLLLRHSNNN